MGRSTTSTHQTPAYEDQDRHDQQRRHDLRGDSPSPTRSPLRPPNGSRAPSAMAPSAMAPGSTDTTSLPSAAEILAELDQHKLAVTVEEAARLLSLNRTKIYTLCMRGELRSFKVGRSRRIPMTGIYEYVERVSA